MSPISQRLAVWWLHRRANAALIFKRNRQAIEAYREMVAVDPSNRFAYIMLGNLLAEAGDTAGATTELRRLLAIDPDNADAWFNLGFLHDKADQLDDAEQCFRRAVQLKPSLDRAWYGLGLVLIRADRLDQAVHALKENIRLQPFSPYGYYQLGMTYHHLGQSEEAWKIHARLADFEPKFSATLQRDLTQVPPRLARTTDNNSNPREEIAAEAT